ncbi:K02A2.6-like, partial [Cordylochernes scorpioides]
MDTSVRRSRRLEGLEPRFDFDEKNKPIRKMSISAGVNTGVKKNTCKHLTRNPTVFSGNGTEDCGKWMKDYERIARSNCWDATMKLANAPFFLEGTAGQWYDNNEEGMDSWDMFKEMFSRTFDNSGVLLRRAKDNLQSRAQKSTESCESYIQDVLSLCRQVNPDMSQGEKVAHLMKGVVEDVYQVILIKEIDTFEAFVDWCRKVEACKQRRIGKPRFERLPNVASIEQPNSSSLEDLIRRIVREEIKSALHFESIVPEVNSLKKIIHEEVERNLTPIAEQGPYYREQRRYFEGPAKPTPYYQQQSPTRLTTARRKTDEWRTVDNIPVCFQCGRPGHVARYCRERRGMVDRQPPGRYHPVQNGPRTIYNSDETPGRTSYRSPSPYPGRGRSPAERRPSISPSRRSGRSPYPKHKINTEDHLPIKRRPYRVSQVERQTIQNEVDKMLKGGIVQLSESPWSSPVVLVKKKNGSWRFCVDYRHLNKITKKDVYPLPRIDDTLDCLRGASYYSSMDLRSGYWQIEVDEADREKTAFITPDGLYEFKVMPFGLCNAPATFERMMDTLLRGLKWSMCLCYLDDIIVFSPTFDEHVRRLELVLRCLSKAGLVLNPDKCLFGTKRLSIFGHLVDGEGVHPDPGKVDAMSKFPTPKSLTDVRSFIGMCSYYRRFIKNFAQKAEPLHRLLRKDTRFEWGPDQRQAYESLKLALASEPVLAHFDEKYATELHTDASGFGIGAVLVQVQGGSEKPIGYASRTLSTAEKNYSTTERECLAAIWAIGKFRPYLFGRSFTIVTDHHSLCWLSGLKDPSGRLARWALRLQEYNVNVVYKNGRKHQDADCLSRNPIEANNPGETGDDIPTLAALTDIVAEQRKDPVIVRISEECQRRKHAPLRPPGLLQPIPPTSVPFQRVGIYLLGRFPISNLGNKWIIVCTDYLTRYAITRALPSADAQQVAKFVLEDVVLKHGAPREIITDRGRVFQSKLISELTGLCSSAQRFTTAYHPQTNGLTERLNKTLADMMSMYVDVEQKEWDVILPFITFAYNTAKQDTTGFTPFSLIHGREAETTLDTLFPLLKDEDQEDYNREIVTRAEETRQLARLHTLRAQEGNKRLYDAKHREVSYQPGDKVWIFIPVRKIGISEKLIKRYFGPYRVTRRISDVTYEVESLDTTNRRRKPKEIVHVVRMKNYRDPDEQLDLPEDEPASAQFQVDLSRLHCSRTCRCTDQVKLSSVVHTHTHTHTLGRAATRRASSAYFASGGCMSSGNTPSLARAESPSKAEEKPARLGSKAQPSAELPARNALKFNSSMKSTKNQRYANPATGGKDANPAAPTDFAAASSSEAAAQAHRNWAELTEDSNSEYEGNFTIVQKRKRRRGSANSSPAAAPSSNLGGTRTNRRPQSSAEWAPRAQEVRTTRAHIVEARARQASSTEDHCVYVERSPELEPYHYIRAIDRMFGSTREVFQVTKMNGHFLVGLANKSMAERLVNEGLEVEGTLHRAFPFRKRAERITVGNLPFFVGDAAVISALSSFGRVTSIAPKLMKAGPYVYNDGRREAFIIFREGMTIERLPTRLDITIKGEAWPAYLSTGIRCSRCRGQGHRRANCPLLAGRTTEPGPATPSSTTSVPPATAPKLPQQPSAQPPPLASHSPAMEVSDVPPASRAALLPPAALRPSPPAPLASTAEAAPPAPPPVTPAPSLRTPGSREPAAPTPDIEMSNVEESPPPLSPSEPAAVPPTPPLPAPQPAGPIPPAPDEEEMTPIMREECMVIEILKKLKHLTCLRPLYQSGIQPNDLKDAIIFIDERESLMARLTPAMRGVLAEFLSAAIEPARGNHPD